MTRLAIGLGGAAAALVIAIFPATVTAHGGDPHDMMEGLAKSMKSPMAVKAQGKTAKLSIVHVLRGCHVWSTGARKAAGAKLFVKPGTRLQLSNMDIDTHRLVRVSGPKIALGKAMRMGDRQTVRFTKRGVYRLMTRKVEGDGMMMKVKTLGEDNVLGLTVIVR